MYKDKIVIPQKLQQYIVKFYHMYIPNTVLDRTEAIIRRHLYWSGLEKAVQMKFTICDTC